ncbi:hypothetical protein BPS13_0061 [Bacillus phage BPS13]|uniref:Uncharacterized protein n=2 Tax=Wphvirus BPS13 TaxID=1987727 RepID=A0A173GBM3_9CAUD|nr:hypothetical protein BPS13_0061 [Bacillus phage BPS13]YP_009281966.1 hypothetical protein SALINJAH_12 [Bacillus phage SalinJah]AEZ50240.1 hypothetical protein BPS13_0061 [Bacillus phage BPS13]ANH50660.1 hypothetical protein SALINJAH_12 [Bacillus phage SalinJah]QSJ04599.1 hypothetical protein BCP18_067 [Bacillus phage BCP18]
MTRHTRDKQLRKLGVTSNHCNVPITVSCYLEIARGKVDHTYNYYEYLPNFVLPKKGFKNFHKTALERYE